MQPRRNYINLQPPLYWEDMYKMCIRAYLNGDGMGYKTHLSLFFVVMNGEFDALLKCRLCLGITENILSRPSSQHQKATAFRGQRRT